MAVFGAPEPVAGTVAVAVATAWEGDAVPEAFAGAASG